MRRLEDERERLTIVAPFNGYITQKSAEEGEWLNAGAPVANLVRLDLVDVVSNIEEVWLPLARLGAQVELQFDALPGQPWQGTIEEIVPRADWESGSRSFPLRIRVENVIANDQPTLMEGMLARVQIKGESRSAMLVPKDSISRSKGSPKIFALISKETDERITWSELNRMWAEAGQEDVICRVQPVDIQEGTAHQNSIDVIEGNINESQVVVTDGVERLRAMQEVRVPNPNPPGSADNNTADNNTGAGNVRPVANR